MASPLEGKRILLVDDDADILTSMQAALEPTGAVIDTANNGNKAVELAEKNHPDIVILDMMLPGRSGFLVLEKIKARKPKNDKPFVIMITGNTGGRHKMYAESLGVSDYFNKPVKLDKLIARAEQLLFTFPDGLKIMRVFLIASMLIAPGAAAQTQPAASPQQEQIAEQVKLEAENTSLPRREVKSIGDVIHFSRAQSQLVARNQLTDLKQETRIIAPDAPGLIKLRPFILQVQPAGEDVGFSFIQHDLTGPPPFHSITSVSLGAGKLTIARDTNQGFVTSSVQLLQDPPSANPDPETPTIVMYVSRTDDSGNSQNLSFKRIANSFDDLCIRYPDDVITWLRPIIRDFKQEGSVFAPDARIAWQVLGGGYIIDPAMLEKVNVLVTKLDADSYEDRQTALAGLREIGQPAAVILMRAERSAMSPEKQSGVDTFLAPYVQLTVDEAKSMRDNPTFLLDILTTDDVELRKLAWERLKSVTNTPVQFDPAGDPTQRAAALDELRATIKK